jgi:hypothetical protein
MKNIFVKYIFILSCLLLPTLAMADPTPPPVVIVENVPIDGGISLLAAAGIGYAAKKIYNARKK